MASLESCKALVFDCYGTLIDWEVGMFQNLEPVFSQKTCPEPERVFRALGKIETRIQSEAKDMIYPDVLELAYKELTGELRLGYDPEFATAFGNSVGSWPAFPDSAHALAKLKSVGLKLFILSNVDNESFSLSRKKLEKETTFDDVYTAENIGTYKPDLRNFRYALDRLDQEHDISANEVIVVANSKYHDVQPAHKMGLKAAWINRADAIMGVDGFEEIKPDWNYSSMTEFANVMEKLRA